MFYVKEEINGVPERISTGGDLCGTSVICSECSKVLKEIQSNIKTLVRNAFSRPYSAEELEKAIEALVLEYWNEVLYRDEAGEIDE